MLLASDLDGTLIATKESYVSNEGIARLHKLFSHQSDNRLAYVTGRGFDLALRGLAEHGLPTPEFLICDVGTSLYHRVDKEYALSEGYQSKLRAIWGEGLFKEIDRLLSDFPECEQQAEDCQTEFKRSFFISVDDSVDKRLDSYAAILEKHGIAASIIFSVDPLTGKGLLDVLPKGVNKEFALTYLHELSGASRAEIVYAGDSGNDLAVFTSAWNAIMVSNTPERVKERARLERGASDFQLFEATKPCVEGVLEGCEHFGFA